LLLYENTYVSRKILTTVSGENVSVQIRVARKKRPKLVHRPFNEREKELNKISRRDMIKQWKLKLNPYKMKGLKEFEKGKSNPFYYMSLYKIQQFIKTLEASGEDLYKEDNDRIMFGIEMIVTFKDLLHVTTSEAVAVYFLCLLAVVSINDNSPKLI